MECDLYQIMYTSLINKDGILFSSLVNFETLIVWWCHAKLQITLKYLLQLVFSCDLELL